MGRVERRWDWNGFHWVMHKVLVAMVGWLERQTLSKATATLVRSEIWLLWYDLPKKDNIMP